MYVVGAEVKGLAQETSKRGRQWSLICKPKEVEKFDYGRNVLMWLAEALLRKFYFGEFRRCHDILLSQKYTACPY